MNKLSEVGKGTFDCATVRKLVSHIDALTEAHERLKADYAQLSTFNPDWDRVDAANQSLREHMALAKELQTELNRRDALAGEVIATVCIYGRSLELKTDVKKELPDGEYKIYAAPPAPADNRCQYCISNDMPKCVHGSKWGKDAPAVPDGLLNDAIEIAGLCKMLACRSRKKIDSKIVDKADNFQRKVKNYRDTNNQHHALFIPDEKSTDIDYAYKPLSKAFNEGWNACRAAMLANKEQK